MLDTEAQAFEGNNMEGKEMEDYIFCSPSSGNLMRKGEELHLSCIWLGVGKEVECNYFVETNLFSFTSPEVREEREVPSILLPRNWKNKKRNKMKHVFLFFQTYFWSWIELILCPSFL